MAQNHDEERRSPRSKVLLSAVVEWDGGSLPVILRDLSEHGALVESTATIPVDSPASRRFPSGVNAICRIRLPVARYSRIKRLPGMCQCRTRPSA